jgi:hypothetical protein
MSNVGAAPRAAVPISNARAAASRRNGARSRGPKTPEGKARAAQNALKHGMRAQRYVLLPQEDAAEFEAFEAAILADLAPEGALQTMAARRVAVAAWRMERADRLEAEVLEVRSYEGASAGVALIRDGNATGSFETLLRYRGAAMAEFWRALRTLKALQAEQAAGADALEMPPLPPRAPARLAANEPERRPPNEYVVLAGAGASRTRREPAACRVPNEPERGPEPAPERRLEYVLPAAPAPGHTLHEPAAPWTPNDAEPGGGGEPEANGAPAPPAPPSDGCDRADPIPKRMARRLGSPPN